MLQRSWQCGDIFLWKGNALEWQFERAHEGSVNALASYPDGFVSGGKDGKIRLWSGLDPVKVMFSSIRLTIENCYSRDNPWNENELNSPNIVIYK